MYVSGSKRPLPLPGLVVVSTSQMIPAFTIVQFINPYSLDNKLVWLGTATLVNWSMLPHDLTKVLLRTLNSYSASFPAFSFRRLTMLSRVWQQEVAEKKTGLSLLSDCFRTRPCATHVCLVLVILTADSRSHGQGLHDHRPGCNKATIFGALVGEWREGL